MANQLYDHLNTFATFEPDAYFSGTLLHQKSCERDESLLQPANTGEAMSSTTNPSM